RRKGTGAVAVRMGAREGFTPPLAGYLRLRSPGIRDPARPVFTPPLVRCLTSGSSRERLAVTDRSLAIRVHAGRPGPIHLFREVADMDGKTPIYAYPLALLGGGVAMFTFLDAPVFALYLAYAVLGAL